MSVSCRRRWTPAKSTDVSIKTERLARLHAAADRQMGQRLLVRPQRGGGYVVGTDDPLRPPAEIIGYVALSPGVERTQGAGGTSGHNPELRLGPDTVKFKTSSLAYAVESGDIVEFLEIESPPARVSRVAPYGTDRTILFLVRTAR